MNLNFLITVLESEYVLETEVFSTGVMCAL